MSNNPLRSEVEQNIFQEMAYSSHTFAVRFMKVVEMVDKGFDRASAVTARTIMSGPPISVGRPSHHALTSNLFKGIASALGSPRNRYPATSQPHGTHHCNHSCIP